MHKAGARKKYTVSCHLKNMNCKMMEFSSIKKRNSSAGLLGVFVSPQTVEGMSRSSKSVRFPDVPVTSLQSSQTAI